ncbi:MAG: fluoride efflux transporter CrcB [Dehalococcoidia bacterium]|nr:fluoride efflux transporter CrcB [Dehalococcoidia bacterium]
MLLIALAGGLGAVSRFALDQWIGRRLPGQFPWGTFAINVSGSFVLGLLFTLLTERYVANTTFRLSLTTGFLGAYTTFSTFALETNRLWGSGAQGLAAVNVAGSVAAALLAVWLGAALARTL